MATLTDGVLTLRPPGEADIDALHRECQDPEIQRWTGVPSPYHREDAVAFLARMAEELDAGRTVPFLAVDGDEVLGSFSVLELDRAPCYGEIGYWVAAGARGRGVATRAVTLLRDWAATELRLNLIELLIHEDNRASMRVAELTGFVDTGELRNAPRSEARRSRWRAERDSGPPRYRVYAWSPA